MANILFLINHAGKAGTERYVKLLAEGAPKYGMRPFFAYNEPGLLLEHMREAGVESRQLTMRGPFDFAAARGLAGICNEFGIDIVHTNYLRENYIAILAKRFFYKKIKIIYTNHFVTPNSLPVKLANRFMTGADHRIISVCDAGAPRLIANGTAKDKILVIHNAIDPFAWRPGPDYNEIRAQIRLAYDIGADETVFLCASRFAHDKGHAFLIDSLARLEADHGVKKIRVLLAGDGPLEPDIRERVNAAGLSGPVLFIGFVKDMKSLFYASDVYLNPSQHEALSFLILEALACGLPVIATDMGGNNEIINEKNNCGILVKYGDTHAMSSAIQSLRTNGALATEMKKNALLTIERDFSVGVMLKKTYDSFA